MNATQLEQYLWDSSGNYVVGNDEYGNPDDRCEIDIDQEAYSLAEALSSVLQYDWKVHLTDEEFVELTKELARFVDGVWFRGSDNVFRDMEDAQEEEWDKRRTLNRMKGIA